MQHGLVWYTMMFSGFIFTLLLAVLNFECQNCFFDCCQEPNWSFHHCLLRREVVMIHLGAHPFIYEENIEFPMFGALPLLTLNIIQLLSPESLG